MCPAATVTSARAERAAAVVTSWRSITRKVRSPTQRLEVSPNRADGVAAPALARHPLNELDGLLGERGCPICRYVEEAERGFFSWFGIESYGEVKVQAQLRAATGMCPAHAQHLVEGGLVDPATVAVYRQHDGLCLPHFLGSIRLLGPATLKIVAERLLITLSVDDGIDLEALAGVDPDAPRRGDRRGGLTEHRPLRVPADRAAHAAKRHGDTRVRVLAWEVAEASRKQARSEPGQRP